MAMKALGTEDVLVEHEVTPHIGRINARHWRLSGYFHAALEVASATVVDAFKSSRISRIICLADSAIFSTCAAIPPRLDLSGTSSRATMRSSETPAAGNLLGEEYQ
jgi:hypothetical protein